MSYVLYFLAIGVTLRDPAVTLRDASGTPRGFQNFTKCKALTLGLDWGNPYTFNSDTFTHRETMERFLWGRHKRVIPVPQLQPLDARDIIKHRKAAAVRAGEYPWYAPEVYELYHPRFNYHSPWVRDGLPPSQRPPLPEVPDMIVFSDSDDSDSDDFCSFDDEFDPFEVLK